MKHKKKFKVLNIISVLILSILFFPLFSNAEEECMSCHSRKNVPVVDPEECAKSVHATLSCTACHISISGYPHSNVSQVKCFICHFTGNLGAKKVKDFNNSIHGKALAAGNANAPNCQTCHGSHAILPARDLRARTSRSNSADLCAGCHNKPFDEYRKSVHGREFLKKKNQSAAVCIDCHMEHHFVSPIAEERWQLQLIKECGICHAEQLNTYRKTFHGKVTKLGYTTVAKCSDCHGKHNILPRAERESSISAEKIVVTCGKCHPGSGVRFAKFYAHPEEGNRKKYPELFYIYMFMTALLVSVFSFFFIHTFLWAYRSLRERTKSGKEEK